MVMLKAGLLMIPPPRFESYGWHVIRAVDGHDADAIKAAIEAARAVKLTNQH